MRQQTACIRPAEMVGALHGNAGNQKEGARR